MAIVTNSKSGTNVRSYPSAAPDFSLINQAYI